MSSSWGSGEGLSFKGEVLGPTGGFVGALNGIGGGGGGGCGGCGGTSGLLFHASLDFTAPLGSEMRYP